MIFTELERDDRYDEEEVIQMKQSRERDQIKALEGCWTEKSLLQVENGLLNAKLEEMENKLAQEQMAMQKARERLKAENVALKDQIEETECKSKKLAEEFILKVREANLRILGLETEHKRLEAKLMDLRIEYKSTEQRHNDTAVL